MVSPLGFVDVTGQTVVVVIVYTVFVVELCSGTGALGTQEEEEDAIEELVVQPVGFHGAELEGTDSEEEELQEAEEEVEGTAG